jgi:hypothetical protein
LDRSLNVLLRGKGKTNNRFVSVERHPAASFVVIKSWDSWEKLTMGEWAEANP